MRILFILLVFAFPLNAAETLALRCGNVFDSKSAKLIGPHTLLVEGKNIVAKVKGLVERKNTKRIDLSDKTCLPGFIDSHVHLSDQSNPKSYEEGFRLDPIDYGFRSVGYAEKTLMAGFTTVRDLGGDVSLHLRDAINRGLIKGPRIFAAGRGIATTGGHGDGTNGLNSEFSKLMGAPGPSEGVINGTDDARQAVRQRYKEGSDVIKITATGGVLSVAKSPDAAQFTVEEIKEVVRTAKDYGFTVAAHAHGKEGMKRAIVAGVDSIEHGSYSDAEIFRLMKAHKTWLVPTLMAGDFVVKKVEIDGYYPEIIILKVLAIAPVMASMFKNAYKAGVPIAFGTDSGVSFHGDNAHEFVLMVQGGMPANEALKSATFNAAALLKDDTLGQLDEGFRADVVAVKGNPLKDIAITKRIDFVMKDGVVFKQ